MAWWAADPARVRETVWAKWLERDPVRFLPRRSAAIRGLKSVFVDCGTRDEFHLQYGARMVAGRLRRLGIHHVHEEFDGGHTNVQYRYDRSFVLLSRALARR